MTTTPSHTSPFSISRSLLLAGLLLGVALALRLLSPAYMNPDIARRTMGVLMGAVVVVYANAVPKVLSPLTLMHCDPLTEQSLRRFAGWSLAFGGLAYATMWAIAPLKNASVLAAWFLGATVLLVIVRLVWIVARGSNTHE